MNAAGALAKLGTEKSLPALEALLSDKRYTGALNVRGMAESARDAIKQRQTATAIQAKK